MMRPALALLSGLLVWAIWFSLAYGLHGAQCAGSIALSRSGGQIVQIGLWFASLAAIALLVRAAIARAAADITTSLRSTARYLQFAGLGATAFVGLPMLVLQPC